MSDAAAPRFLAEQFEDVEQQHEAAKLGMGFSSPTEVLFFGGLFHSYTVYRYLYPDAFAAASRHTEVILGGQHRRDPLFSSTLMALAVRASKLGRRKELVRLLLATAFFGMIFMGVKGFEYHKDFIDHLVPGVGFQWHEPNRGAAELFWWLYWP